MPTLKVFISSTCYDLGQQRTQVDDFLKGLGHKGFLSEYSDILYDPTEHTHVSCIKAVKNCDLVVLLIGGRFGGTVVPEALKLLDQEKLLRASRSQDLLKNPEKLSITQAEILYAINHEIPVYPFVKNDVYDNHKLYQDNKAQDFIDEIKFSAIEKDYTAKYIFEFINFLRHRHENNNLTVFSKIADVEKHLRKQWSSQLKKFLVEQKAAKIKERKVQVLDESTSKINKEDLTKYQDMFHMFMRKGGIKILEKLLEAGVTLADILAHVEKKSSWRFDSLLPFGSKNNTGIALPEKIKNLPEIWKLFMALTLEQKKTLIDDFKRTRTFKKKARELKKNGPPKPNIMRITAAKEKAVKKVRRRKKKSGTTGNEIKHKIMTKRKINKEATGE